MTLKGRDHAVSSYGGTRTTSVESRYDLSYALLATPLTIALIALVPIWVYETLPQINPTSTDDVVLAWIAIAISGTRLAFIIGNGRPQLFAFAFWTYGYLFLALPAFAQVLTSKFPSTTPWINTSFINEALWVVIAGFIAFQLGSWMASARKNRSHESVRPPRLLSKDRVTVVAIAALAVAAFYIVRVGPESLFTSREEIGAVRSNVFGDSTTTVIVSALARLPLLVCVHAMTLIRRDQRARGERRSFGLLLPLCLTATLLTINIFTSSRYLFGTMLFSLLVLWGAFATRARARLAMSSLIAVMLFAFPLFASFRRSTTEVVETGAGSFIQSGDYDSFAQLVNSIHYVATEGILWGRQLLAPLVFWVPSSIWPSKPIDTGVLIAQFKGYRFEVLSSPFWAEAYLAAGWVGVIVLFVLLGILLRRIDFNVPSALATTRASAIASAILSFYTIIMLRGSLLAATSTLAVVLLSIFLVSKRARDPSEGESWSRGQ